MTSHAPARAAQRGHIVVIGGQKGGTGKSTTAFNLAVMARRHGLRTLLLDCDPQGTASKLAALRGAQEIDPHIVCAEKLAGRDTSPFALSRDIEGLAAEYDIVIVDVGGFDSERRKNPEMRGALLVADTFLIPLHPTPIDAWSLSDVVETLQRATEARSESAESRSTTPRPLCSLAVYAKVPSNPGERDGLIAKARAFKDQLAGELIADSGCYLTNRKVFAMSVAEGLGVIEGKDRKAKDEMLKLFRVVVGEGYHDKIKYPAKETA